MTIDIRLHYPHSTRFRHGEAPGQCGKCTSIANDDDASLFYVSASCTIPGNTQNGIGVQIDRKVKKKILKKKDDDSHQGDISSPCPSPVIAEPVIAKSSESSLSSHRSIRFTMDTARIENERMFHRISHLLLANFALFSAFLRLVSSRCNTLNCCQWLKL